MYSSPDQLYFHSPTAVPQPCPHIYQPQDHHYNAGIHRHDFSLYHDVPMASTRANAGSCSFPPQVLQQDKPYTSAHPTEPVPHITFVLPALVGERFADAHPTTVSPRPPPVPLTQDYGVNPAMSRPSFPMNFSNGQDFGLNLVSEELTSNQAWINRHVSSLDTCTEMVLPRTSFASQPLDANHPSILDCFPNQNPLPYVDAEAAMKNTFNIMHSFGSQSPDVTYDHSSLSNRFPGSSGQSYYDGYPQASVLKSPVNPNQFSYTLNEHSNYVATPTTITTRDHFSLPQRTCYSPQNVYSTDCIMADEAAGIPLPGIPFPDLIHPHVQPPNLDSQIGYRATHPSPASTISNDNIRPLLTEQIMAWGGLPSERINPASLMSLADHGPRRRSCSHNSVRSNQQSPQKRCKIRLGCATPNASTRFPRPRVRKGKSRDNSTTICKWLEDDGTECREAISSESCPGHLIKHRITNLASDEIVSCRWCRPENPMKRRSIVRHVREGHLGRQR